MVVLLVYGSQLLLCPERRDRKHGGVSTTKVQMTTYTVLVGEFDPLKPHFLLFFNFFYSRVRATESSLLHQER